MKNPFISIIIVNWNGKSFLHDCLTSLEKNSYKNYEILFVDNASTDDSIAYVKQHFPSIKIISNTKNLGFAGGHQVAFEKARGDAILLLNTDTLVKKNLIKELIHVLYSQKDIGLVQPKILLYYHKKLIDSVGSFFLGNGLLYHYGHEKNHTLSKYNKQMEIFSAKGVCVLMKQSVLQKTGLFDKDFFCYFEETDLCLRIWLAGYKVIYTPKTAVYHKEGGSSKQSNPFVIQYHSSKNALCTYLKNLSFTNLLKVIPSLLFLYQTASLFYLVTGRFGDFFITEKAIWWNVTHIRDTLKKRSYIQHNIRVVKDSDFLPKLTKKVKFSYFYYKVFGGMGNYVDNAV